MKHLILFILMTESLFSCGSSTDFCNRKEAKYVLGNFSREYTGLDTLIRTDGYYYHEDNTGLLHGPIIMSKNGEFQTHYAILKSHNQIQEWLRKYDSQKGKGSYILSGDTITVKWAMLFQFNCYNVFSGQYIIENDTTLRLIWQESRNSQRNPVRNEIYKFYKYPVND